MKKLISLLTALLLCLCAMLPALAEEPAPSPAPALLLPMTLETYQQAYEAVIADVLPDCTVTWSTAPIEGGECYMATINSAFISVMLLPVDGQVTELAVLLQADMSESTLMTFLSMAGYAGAALLRSEEVTSMQACDAFIGELLNVFNQIYAGTQPGSIYGLPGGINITPMPDGTYQYYFILKLNSAE